ncbi:MucBP domain-containing protein [Listeria sp. FSL L7-1485]|uniref:MucBP domain-containing protein n=1 Tax=Listeria immobilis TaxID=2713502 RepID=A0A7X0X7X5_9LIST|nr:MucBP domain-containing protein [Listeria immobilis]MBC1489233.1 MucBP domain-containing protein [Listeria immobilis]MBC1536403.1 MucBP domain-containing protein [Listeria immobilis]
MKQRRKLYISFLLLFSIVSMTLVPYTAKAAPLMLNIPAPQVDQLYIGDDYITGTLQQEVPMHYPGNGAFVFLNNKQYNVFDYTVENDTYFRLKLPKTLEAGDTLNYFAITGNVLDPVAYPGQESYKMAGPFTPIEKAEIQVNYLDEASQPLTNSDTLKGKIGESYTTTPKAIDGYQLKITPNNATGTFTTNTEVTEVNYVYEIAPSIGENVTVQYIDEATNQAIAQSETLTGNIGASYQAAAKTIDGYELAETPSNQSGIFSADAQTVIYKYKKVTPPAIAQDITVTYQATDGKTLMGPIILTGNLGTSYETEAKSFVGYTLTKKPANSTGTFTTEAQSVHYIYEKTKPIVAEDVTVSYEDTNGNVLSDSIILKGNVGEIFETEAKSFVGYTLTKQPTNKIGTFTTSAQDVLYVYTKNKDNAKIIPREPLKLTGIASKSTEKANLATSQSLTKMPNSLPKTGDTSSNTPLIIGIILIIGAGYMITARKKIK